MQTIEKIQGVDKQWAARLRALDLTTTAKLLGQTRYPKNRRSLARKIAATQKQVTNWVSMADLLRIKGLSGTQANLLHSIGITRVDDLEQLSLKDLEQKLRMYAQKNKAHIPIPRVSTLKRWQSQAQSLETKIFFEDPQIPVAPTPVVAKLARSNDQNTPGQKVGFHPGAAPPVTTAFMLRDWFYWMVGFLAVVAISAVVYKKIAPTAQEFTLENQQVILLDNELAATTSAQLLQQRSRQNAQQAQTVSRQLSALDRDPRMSVFSQLLREHLNVQELEQEQLELTFIAPTSDALEKLLEEELTQQERAEIVNRHVLLERISDLSFATNQKVLALSGEYYTLSTDNTQKGGLQKIGTISVYWQAPGVYTTPSLL